MIKATVLWLAPVGYFTYTGWPSPYYSAHIAGCIFPAELFSLSAPAIVGEELDKWRRELPLEAVQTLEAGSKIPPPERPRRFLTEESLGYGFPGWKGDTLGRPKWAQAPLVRQYCKTLFVRLEETGRIEKLREASSDLFWIPHLKWLASMLAKWILPCLGVYLLGLGLSWVRRGFRSNEIKQ